jgi:hypothetical protein
MLKHASVPLLFLFVGSLLGIFLRWQFISPTPGINYTFFLHGHSHVMFLGWIFNALFIGFVSQHITEKEHNFFRKLFYVLQVLVVGMLISFPLQGYGLFSIAFSTLHTIGAIVFVVVYLNRTKSVDTTSRWYARIALVFFVISTIGPFSLAYLMANGLGHTNWYYFAIYFYLHFQYNGFFLFGIFSLLFNLLESRKVKFDLKKAKAVGVILAGTCIPAYFLSVLWADPGYIFNVVGGAAAALQVFAFIVLIIFIVGHRQEFVKSFSRSSLSFLLISIVAFAIKLMLQFVSCFPALARMAYDIRPVVIAYLHLVLLGLISLPLFVWYLERNLVSAFIAKRSVVLFLFSFTGMQVCLILSPWWSQVFGSGFYSSAVCTFAFSIILSLSCLSLYISSLQRNLTKVTF